jgi:hypothetical protein
VEIDASHLELTCECQCLMIALGRVPLLSGSFGAILGFISATLLWRIVDSADLSPERAVSFAKPSPSERGVVEEDPALERAEQDTPTGKTRPVEGAVQKAAALEVPTPKDVQLAAELERLRAREREAQKEVGQSRRRINALERELGVERQRQEFDLTPEDWRKLGTEGTMKYRVPCANPKRALSDETLDKLGLAPDDRAVLEKAYQSSARRLGQQLLPFCARALGNRMDLAEAVGVDACTSVILKTAHTRREDTVKSGRRVAAVMAGDATVTEDFNITDLAFLALAEESGRFEQELAEAFGPEDAHRIAFSPDMCFSSSIHLLAKRPTSEPR